MNSPTRTDSLPSLFSLYWVIRRNSPMVAVHSSSQVSWVCSGTWLWTKMAQRSRVEPDGEEVAGGVERVAPEHRRVDLVGEGMQVDHAVEGVAVVLERHPVPERPQVVAEGEVARGGDAGQDPFHGAPW